MIANQAAQDAIAQNLANASTTGYKQDVPRFEAFGQVLLQRLSGGRGSGPAVGMLGNGAGVSALATDFADGALQKTGNPLDVALTGDAFLTVQTPQGVRFSRDGALARNRQGLLAQANGGALVLGQNGLPLHLPAKAKDIIINSRGDILADGVSAGRMRLAGISRESGAVKIGDNLFAAANMRSASPTAAVQQGYLEASNVSVVKEMVAMISVMRAYETNQKMVQAEDEATGKAVAEVAKL